MRLIAYTRLSVAQGNGNGNGKPHSDSGSGSGKLRSDSLEHQEEEIRAWCKAHGHRLAGVHRDDGRSGTLDEGERPGLASALSQLEAGADGLVVHRLDRLARALHVQEAILGTVWALGGHVFSAVEGEVLRDDPTDPMRTFVRQVMGAAAQLERGMIVARMQGGRRRAKKHGKHIGGTVPFGFDLRDGLLVPLPVEQKTVRWIRNLRTRGWSYGRIAARLNEDGVATKTGARWYAMTVRLIAADYDKAAPKRRRVPAGTR